jgi:hypothetical protein
MNTRRGFLRSLGVATLAVALDVLPRFGAETASYLPSGPPEAEVVEWLGMIMSTRDIECGSSPLGVTSASAQLFGIHVPVR